MRFYLENIQIKICYEVFSIVENAMIDLRFQSTQGIEIAHATHRYDLQNFIELKKGKHEVLVELINNFHPGTYFISVGIHKANGKTLDFLENILSVNILDHSYGQKNEIYPFSWKVGSLKLRSNWSFNSIN